MSRGRNSAAVLVLIREGRDGREVLLIQRSATVKTHQSQVAFPGGGAEPGEEGDPARTAIRECFEEVGVSPHHIQVQRILQPIPTLTGNFQVFPVLASLNEAIAAADRAEFVLDPQEVAHAEWVPLEALLKTRTEEFGFPVFEWLGIDQTQRKVWGLTAIILDLIFHSRV